MAFMWTSGKVAFLCFFSLMCKEYHFPQVEYMNMSNRGTLPSIDFKRFPGPPVHKMTIST